MATTSAPVVFTEREIIMLRDGLEASTQYMTIRELSTKQDLLDKLARLHSGDPSDTPA